MKREDAPMAAMKIAAPVASVRLSEEKKIAFFGKMAWRSIHPVMFMLNHRKSKCRAENVSTY